MRQPISIHSLLAEGDPATPAKARSTARFQSTPSSRRETLRGVQSGGKNIFQSTPSSRRETPLVEETINYYRKFQSTPSSRRETLTDSPISHAKRISIHSLLAEGDFPAVLRSLSFCISIHSLLAEGDFRKEQNYVYDFYFNPLPPRGGRQIIALSRWASSAFQSTPSSRRETSSSLSAMSAL